MTYLLLDLAFLVPVLVVAMVAAARRRAPWWPAVGAAAVVLLVTTVVFDNVLVALGIVAYDPARILGIRMPIAPVEDLSYAIAAVVLLPCLWTLLAGRGSRGAAEIPGRRRKSVGAEEEGRRS